MKRFKRSVTAKFTRQEYIGFKLTAEPTAKDTLQHGRHFT